MRREIVAAAVVTLALSALLSAGDEPASVERTQNPEEWEEAGTNRATTWVAPADLKAVLERVERHYPPAANVANISVEAARKEESPIAGLAGFVEKHRGRRVAIEIGATWCLPCREAWPAFVELAGRHTGVAFALLAAEEELGGPYLLDALTLFLRTGSITLPSYALLDESGRLLEGRLFASVRSVEVALKQWESAPEPASTAGGDLGEVLATVTEAAELNMGKDPLGRLIEIRDYMGVFEGLTGVKTYCPESLQDYRVGIKGMVPLDRLPGFLCDFAGCTLHAFAFEDGDTPLLVLVPRPGRRGADPKD